MFLMVHITNSNTIFIYLKEEIQIQPTFFILVHGGGWIEADKNEMNALSLNYKVAFLTTP